MGTWTISTLFSSKQLFTSSDNFLLDISTNSKWVSGNHHHGTFSRGASSWGPGQFQRFFLPNNFLQAATTFCWTSRQIRNGFLETTTTELFHEERHLGDLDNFNASFFQTTFYKQRQLSAGHLDKFEMGFWKPPPRNFFTRSVILGTWTISTLFSSKQLFTSSDNFLLDISTNSKWVSGNHHHGTFSRGASSWGPGQFQRFFLPNNFLQAATTFCWTSRQIRNGFLETTTTELFHEERHLGDLDNFNASFFQTTFYKQRQLSAGHLDNPLNGFLVYSSGTGASTWGPGQFQRFFLPNNFLQAATTFCWTSRQPS